MHNRDTVKQFSEPIKGESSMNIEKELADLRSDIEAYDRHAGVLVNGMKGMVYRFEKELADLRADVEGLKELIRGRE